MNWKKLKMRENLVMKRINWLFNHLGILVLEFLLKYFDKLFDYEYTKNMETDLDIIAKGNKIWHNLCRDCFNDINECSKELGDGCDKQIIKIDERTCVYDWYNMDLLLKRMQGGR